MQHWKREEVHAYVIEFSREKGIALHCYMRASLLCVFTNFFMCTHKKFLSGEDQVYSLVIS